MIAACGMKRMKNGLERQLRRRSSRNSLSRIITEWRKDASGSRSGRTHRAPAEYEPEQCTADAQLFDVSVSVLADAFQRGLRLGVEVRERLFDNRSHFCNQSRALFCSDSSNLSHVEFERFVGVDSLVNGEANDLVTDAFSAEGNASGTCPDTL